MGKNTLRLDVRGFEEYLHKLEDLEADLKPIVADALEQAAETIEYDTIDAVAKEYLPAGGEYSLGDTEASIVRNAKVKWSGTTAEINVGFDYSKPGAGGLLITGTPRMRPDTELNKMYKGKRYMKQIQNDMAEVFKSEIEKRMGG